MYFCHSLYTKLAHFDDDRSVGVTDFENFMKRLSDDKSKTFLDCILLSYSF